jgi:hypothetical protein
MGYFYVYHYFLRNRCSVKKSIKSLNKREDTDFNHKNCAQGKEDGNRNLLMSALNEPLAKPGGGDMEK